MLGLTLAGEWLIRINPLPMSASVSKTDPGLCDFVRFFQLLDIKVRCPSDCVELKPFC